MTPRLSVTRLEDRAVPAAYTLDPSFGGDGRVDSAAGPVAVQADGKVVVATASFVSSPDGAITGNQVVVRRLNADGTPDPTFGTGGEYAVGGAITPVEVRVDAQDRVTVLGTDGAGLVVSRPGGYGDVRLPVANSSPPRFADMEVLADGSVLVAARSSGGSGNEARTVIEVRRVTPAGRVDAAGTRTFEPDLGSLAGGANSPDRTADRTRDLLLRPDGAIFLARASAGDSPGGVVKLRPDGSRDTSFDGDGIQAITADANLPRQDALSVFPAPDGSVLVYGVSRGEVNFNAAFPQQPETGVLTRLTAAGAFDPAFGSGGSALIGNGVALRTFDAAYFRSDGGVILVGNLATPPVTRFGAGRNAVQVAVASADGQRFEVLTGPFDDDGSVGPLGTIGTAATGSALDAAERVILSGDLDPTAGFGSGVARLVVPASPFDAGTGSFLVGGPGSTAVRVGLAGSNLASGPLVSLPGFSAAGVPQVSTRVAAADLTGDGVPDFVAGTGPGYGSRSRSCAGTRTGRPGRCWRRSPRSRRRSTAACSSRSGTSPATACRTWW